uniref:Uncharacterized protein n=1 Tax=Rhizobium loti TaxID=381 RepID=Q8KGU5_RHILI|nr:HYPOTHETICAL PROTEIN [Mesorhizobium japonicum R7A]
MPGAREPSPLFLRQAQAVSAIRLRPLARAACRLLTVAALSAGAVCLLAEP